MCVCVCVCVCVCILLVTCVKHGVYVGITSCTNYTCKAFAECCVRCCVSTKSLSVHIAQIACVHICPVYAHMFCVYAYVCVCVCVFVCMHLIVY